MRVITTGGARIEGDFDRFVADTLFLRIARPNSPTAVPVNLIRTYAASPGVSRGAGALRGLIIAGSLGLIVAGTAVVSDATNGEPGSVGASVFYVPAAVALTVAGTALGAMIGKRRWGTSVAP